MKDFVSDPGGYFTELACDATIYWYTHKTEVISTVVGVGALALTTALTVATGGTAMLVIGIGIGALQSGIDSYVQQANSGYVVDWGTVGKEALKGGIISGISGGIGGAAANAVTPLEFCSKGAMEILADVTGHWAVATVADGTTGMLTTYVSERLDGQSAQEAWASTMDSSGQIWENAIITGTVGTAFDAFTAPKCFVAGTMITTATGLVAIENIGIGDIVLAQNPETGEIAYKKVLDTFRNETDVVVRIQINDEIIFATEEHPFYVEGKGWVNANALHAGMMVWLADGTKTIIQDVQIIRLDTPIAVYNFKVEDFHTYFVGYSGILVHNANCNNVPVTENEITTYKDFKNRSVSGDNLEGHEIWQFANMNEQGLADARATGEVGGGNIVIALSHDVHVQVNRQQADFNPRSQTPEQNIKANLNILHNVLGDDSGVDFDALSTKVFDFMKSVTKNE